MLIDAILVAISRGSKLRYYQAQGTAMCHLLPLMIPLLQPFGLSNYSENLLTFEAKELCDVE